MKLSKTSWIIITIGIVVVAFGSLGLARHQQVLEQTQLRDELSVTTTRLQKTQIKPLQSQHSELQEQFDQALSQLETAKDELRQPIESIGVTDSIFDIAEACDIEITRINSSTLGSDKLEGISYAVIRLTITVEGDVPDFISFVTKLNNDFGTGIASSVQMGITGASEEMEGETEGEGEGEAEEEPEEVAEEEPEEVAEEEPDRSTGTIRMVIYTYEG